MKKSVLESFKGLEKSQLVSILGGYCQETTCVHGNSDKLDMDTSGEEGCDDPNYTTTINGQEVDYWNEHL